MQTILVTGCAGLIGNHFSRYLLVKGHKVIGIDDLSGGYADYLPSNKNFKFYEFNLEDKEKLSTVFSEQKIDALYHFAAYASEGLSAFIRNFNYTNNLICSVNLINECIKHNCKIIFTSSMAVYGDSPPPFKESMVASPVDPYGIAKYAVEMDLKQAGDQFGLRYSIVRPHNVVGVYQNIWDKYRNVIGIFLYNIINNKPILIYGDGEQTRAFSDVKFCLDPIYSLINNFDGETFNIGADKYYSINQLIVIVKKACQSHGLAVEIKSVQARHEVKHAWCDHTKAKNILGFDDQTNLEKMVSEMLTWSLNQPNRKQKYMNYELDNVYDYWK